MKAILTFDPCSDGHHAGYILNLMRYLHQNQSDIILQLLVSEAFVVQHDDLVEFASRHLHGQVNWWTLDPAETREILHSPSPWVRGVREWQALARHAERIKHDAVLHMYADYVVHMLARQKKLRAPVSGILFRQNLHYPKLFGTRFTLKEQLTTSANGKLLEWAMRNPAVESLHCLDPYLPIYFSEHEGGEKLGPCADPVYIDPDAPVKKPNSLNFNQRPRRKRVLLFGVVSKRKGFANFLQAVASLDARTLEQLSFQVVGPTREDDEEARLGEVIRHIEAKGGHIIRENRFVKDSELPGYFAAADCIVAPYLRHMGMSAILVRAAMARKPVLASDFGLMGRLVNKHQLGETFSVDSEREIQRAVRRFIKNEDLHFSASAAARFAAQNGINAFGHALLENYLPNRQNPPASAGIKAMYVEEYARPREVESAAARTKPA